MGDLRLQSTARFSDPVNDAGHRRLHRAFRVFALAVAVLVTGTGLIALVGWMLDQPLLSSALPGQPRLKANAAFALVLCGSALGLLTVGRPAAAQRAGRLLAALAIIVGGATLVQYLANVDLGIDELVFRDLESRRFPGRMSAGTAVDLVLIGLALLLLDIRLRNGHRPADWLALVAGAIALLGVVAHLYDALALYEVVFYSDVSLHSALALLLLALGILAARPDEGLLLVTLREDASGVVARRLLPTAIGLPMLVGWLIAWAGREQYYRPQFGLALFALANIAMLTLITALIARALHRSEDDRRRAEEQARANQEELQRLYHQHALGALASIFAHEINQPLTAIAGYSRTNLRLLESGRTGDQLRLNLERTVQQADRAAGVIRQIRGFLRAGELRTDRVGLTGLIRDVLAQTAADATAENIDLRLRADEAPDVLVDRTAIEKVLVNLLRNSIEAIRLAGSPGGRIEISAGEDGPGMARVTVRDNGPGLDAQSRAHLFEPFRTTKPDGLGVGLAVSRTIIEAHGGRLWADDPERGAVLHFTLMRAT